MCCFLAWENPSNDRGIIYSNNKLPDNVIQLIKERWQKKRRSYDFIERYRKKFYREKKIDIITPDLPKTPEHALGDFSEACIEISLIEGWGMSDKNKSKWIHPMSGSAPGRGIDIICFSPPDIKDFREGIWLFEVKGANSKSSIDTQCRKVKNFINRDIYEIQRELKELDSWIVQITHNNLELSKYLAQFLMFDPPNIHLSGGIVYSNNIFDFKKINNLKDSLRGFSRTFRTPGLILLFSDELKDCIQSYLKGEVFE